MKNQTKHVLLVLMISFGMSIEAMGQQGTITMPATFLDRIMVGGGVSGGIMPRTYINDSSTETITSFSGLTFSEMLGFQISKHWSIKLENENGGVKGKVKLIDAVPQFTNAAISDPFVAQTPGLANQIQATTNQLSAPPADLSLRMKSEVPSVTLNVTGHPLSHLGWIGPFSKVPFTLGAGFARTTIDYLTLAKGGVPDGLSINPDGSLSVTTTGLYDKGTQSHWSGTVRVGIPIRIREGIEFNPGYDYLAGQHQLGITVNVYPFRVGKPVRY